MSYVAKRCIRHGFTDGRRAVYMPGDPVPDEVAQVAPGCVEMRPDPVIETGPEPASAATVKSKPKPKTKRKKPKPKVTTNGSV